MRRVLIFLLVLTIPIGLISGATKAIGALQDDVEITEQTLYGDKGMVSGRQVRLMTTLNEHIWWLTDYTAGEPGESETEFTFSQRERTEEADWDFADFSLYSSQGSGMSTSGGDGFTFEEEGLGRVLQAVADIAQPGETVTQEVLMEDYMDTYPLDYYANIISGQYFIDESYDAVSLFRSDSANGKESFAQWSSLFRFPLEPGQRVEVTLTKDPDGQVRDVNFSLLDSPTINFVSYVGEEGMYFSPSFQSWDNQPISTGEYPEGYGLYYIPFQMIQSTQEENTADIPIRTWRQVGSITVNGVERMASTFDFDGLQLVYGTNSGDEIISIEESPDGTCLQILTREDGIFCYCVLDLATRQIVQHIPITQDDGQGYGYHFFREQELLYLTLRDRVALVDISGTPKVEFVAPWPADVVLCMPEDIRYQGGVVYLTALDWEGGQQIFYLAVLDETGLGYCGYYYSNLKRHDMSGGNGYISMDKITFLD